MMINVVSKLMPTAAKTLGWKGALEIAALASIGAEALNVVVSNGTAFAKDKLDGKLENNKQKLLEKKAALVAQKEATQQVVITEEPAVEEKVEEKPKASNKKGK